MPRGLRDTIIQEFKTYISGIKDVVRKIHEETLKLVSEIYAIDEDLNEQVD